MKNNLIALISYSEVQQGGFHLINSSENKTSLEKVKFGNLELHKYHHSAVAQTKTLKYVVFNFGLELSEVKKLKTCLDRFAKAFFGKTFSKLQNCDRLKALKEIKVQLKKGSKAYKEWNKSFSTDQLAELKQEVSNQIKKSKPVNYSFI